MFFNLCTHFQPIYLSSAAAVAMAVILFSTIKEKRDERKGA
jgi:hypothetical protein